MLKKFLYKILFFIISFPIALILILNLFNPIFNAEHLIFPYAIHPFDIVSVYPDTWILLKKLYLISFFISYLILYNKFFSNIKFPKNKINKKINQTISSNELSLL